jgi:hypothetical protein
MVNSPKFGSTIASLEGARSGKGGGGMGGGGNVHVYMDRASFSRAMQEDSAGWFHEMSAANMRKNS